MDYDLLTFGLAFAGYLLLCSEVVLRAGGRAVPGSSLLLAAVVATHVACVWSFRFGGSFDLAYSGREPGFFLFHGALLLIVTAPFVERRWTDRLLGVAFVIVSLGAIGASFKYEVVSILRLPVVAACLATGVAAPLGYRQRHR